LISLLPARAWVQQLLTPDFELDDRLTSVGRTADARTVGGVPWNLAGGEPADLWRLARGSNFVPVLLGSCLLCETAEVDILRIFAGSSCFSAKASSTLRLAHVLDSTDIELVDLLAISCPSCGTQTLTASSDSDLDAESDSDSDSENESDFEAEAGSESESGSESDSEIEPASESSVSVSIFVGG